MSSRLICGTLALLATLSSGVVLAGGMATVDQRGLSFGVSSLSVTAGTVVTFQNSDTTSHNIIITGNGANLNSGLQAPGVAFRAPFFKPGTYQVICGIHPKMNMTVIVK